MHSPAGPSPRGPASQAHHIGGRAHAGELGQRQDLDASRRIDTNLGNPAPQAAPAQGDAHDRADRQPVGAAVGVPSSGNAVVERLVETDNIGQHPNDQHLRGTLNPLRNSLRGRCRLLRPHDRVGVGGLGRFLQSRGRAAGGGRCGLLGWLLEGELALGAGAQRPRADFRSSRRSVLSHVNSPSRQGRPKWP